MLCPIMSGPDVVCHGCINLATVAAILLRQLHDRVVDTEGHAASFWRLGKRVRFRSGLILVAFNG